MTRQQRLELAAIVLLATNTLSATLSCSKLYQGANSPSLSPASPAGFEGDNRVRLEVERLRTGEFTWRLKPLDPDGRTSEGDPTFHTAADARRMAFRAAAHYGQVIVA